MYFQPVPVGLEPGPDLTLLVVRGVVLNQNGSWAALSSSRLFAKPQGCGGMENRVRAILKTRAPQLEGAGNFDALALAGDGNFRWPAYAAPGGVERRILPEAGFAGEEERPVARAGFFKPGRDAAGPAILPRRIGARQHPAGPLHRKPRIPQ